MNKSSSTFSVLVKYIVDLRALKKLLLTKKAMSHVAHGTPNALTAHAYVVATTRKVQARFQRYFHSDPLQCLARRPQSARKPSTRTINGENGYFWLVPFTKETKWAIIGSAIVWGGKCNRPLIFRRRLWEIGSVKCETQTN